MRAGSWRRTGAVVLLVAAGLGAGATAAGAQSFTIDDNPSAPSVGPTGPIPGCGPEDPYGTLTAFCPGLAPSPTLALLLPPSGGGSVLAPGPALMLAGPNGNYLDGLSGNRVGLSGEVVLHFSVDRLSAGAPGSAVAQQAALSQQSADVFASTRRFVAPGSFAGSLGAGPYAGALASDAGGPASNALVLDDSLLGLRAGSAGVVAPDVAASAIGAGTHDNLSGWAAASLDGDADGLVDVWTYFSVNPDEALLVSAAPADLFDVAVGAASTSATPYALAASLGLDAGGAGTDSIDALVVFDAGAEGGAGNGGPGAQPGIDYALFSLAPGSASLATHGLSAADVFFSDFSGAFALYAASGSLGLVGAAGGAPAAGDNLDALEVATPPPPVPALRAPLWGALALLLAGSGAGIRVRRPCGPSRA